MNAPMTKPRFLIAGASAALASALALTAIPAAAQVPDWGREARAESRSEERDSRSHQREARAEDSAPAAASAPQTPARSSGWGAGMRARSENPTHRAEAPAAAEAPARGGSYGSDRNASSSAPRDRSYGAYTRNRDWAAQRQARDNAAGHEQPAAGWAHPGDRRSGSGEGWSRSTDRSADARHADWRRDSREDERRDHARNYRHGYRDGYRADNRWDHRSDHRYGQNHRRWDHRHWRSDNRYDWYRYRAANRSLFSLGRYYAPHRGYNYSRISIGIRLGSPFYSSRYWINDPWRYRLPDAYGPYRWVRYYDDALLVDIYSGEVVDVIHNFFW